MAITLDAQLLEILACPSPDHAPLRPGTPDDADAEALTCTECGRVYPVRDGIPVLLLDEAVLSGDHTPGEPDDSHADSA
ncbi:MULTISPECIES: Trm112 family protein [unclassified Amycolatopsis]|uniref:Trm112 family protein n=1 Tax=unclassified Amycolatopsis TaxID=2618356 RepID=UPI001C69E5CB|nr:Trm112 family protein [Amycolatopsis sp. DSM 110486]QYN22817.1 Trm112 family protein [Amycolatopsis sp. DSM 110486]